MTGGNKWWLLVFSRQTSGATACSGRDFKLFFENLKCCNCCHKGWRTPEEEVGGSEGGIEIHTGRGQDLQGGEQQVMQEQQGIKGMQLQSQ